jgi:hypothetical protein
VFAAGRKEKRPGGWPGRPDPRCWSLSGFDGIKAEALGFYFVAFSSREPVSTSLENAPSDQRE